MLDPNDLIDLPDISYPNGDIRSLRQQTSVLVRLPSIPGAAVEKYFAASRQQEAADYSAAMGIAYEEDRQRNIIMRAKARAEARLAQMYAEGRI